jgi:hypothetical protein
MRVHRAIVELKSTENVDALLHASQQAATGRTATANGWRLISGAGLLFIRALRVQKINAARDLAIERP